MKMAPATTFARGVDVELRLRNPSFFKWYCDAMRRLDLASSTAFKDPRAARARDAILKQLLHETGYNFSTFLPYYFPKYPKNKPLSLTDYPQNHVMYGMPLNSSLTVRGARQLGKSVSLSTRQIITTWCIPYYRSLYIVPHPKQLETYWGKMAEMMRGFRFKVPSNLKQNLQYREMPQGGIIKLVNVLTSAHPVRGNTFDEILYDEYQNFDYNLEAQIDEVVSASDYKIRVYAGTSLTTDTALEYRYRESAQSVWVVRCQGCNFDNWADNDCKFGDRGVMDMVQKDGPCCIKCGKPLQVRNGQWLHRNQKAYEEGIYGIHLPQITVPAKVEDTSAWADIYKKSRNPLMVSDFFKEKLGIPLDKGEREITLEHLKLMCAEGREQQHYINLAKGRKEYKYVISGVDWGGSDYDPAKKTKTSYTCHVMLGITHSGMMFILSIDQHSGADFREIAKRIVQKHKSLGGTVIASDHGGGAQYNVLLRDDINPMQHMVLDYSGPTSAMIQPMRDSALTNSYSINRTETITLLYELIKQDCPRRLACFQFAQAEPRLMEILNLFRAPLKSDQTGRKTFTYVRDPSKPDDTLHALNYATVAARCVMGEPLFEDKATMDYVALMLRSGSLDKPMGVMNMRSGMPAPYGRGGSISG